MEGWICPKCGRALAPWMSECPCYLNATITTNGFTYDNKSQPASVPGGLCPIECANKNANGYCTQTTCTNTAPFPW